MEKLKKHLHERLNPVTLYYDDVVKLVSIFKEAGDDIIIEFDEYKLQSLQEMLEIDIEKSNNLSITLTNPNVSLDCRKDTIWIYAGEDTPVYRGVFEKIKQYMVSKKRMFSPVYHSNFLSGGIAGLAVWPLFYIKEDKEHIVLWLFTALLMLTVGLVWMYFGHIDKFEKYSVIIPKPRLSAPGFFKKNRDVIIVSLITAVFSALITWIITRFF